MNCAANRIVEWRGAAVGGVANERGHDESCPYKRDAGSRGCLHGGEGVDRVLEIAMGLVWRGKDGLRNIYIWIGGEI